MYEHGASVDRAAHPAALKGRIQRLAAERGVLFDRAGLRFGLSKGDQERLHAIECELDECFLERRRVRAERDATRFDPYARIVRATSHSESLR